MSPKLKKFVQSWIINTLAVLIAVYVVPGIRFKDQTSGDQLIAALMTALVLGVLNAFIRPILMLFALPVIVFTLGLFMLVINGLLLYLVGIVLKEHFEVAGFGSAVLGALVISIVSVLLNSLTGTGRARIEIHRHRGGPPDSDKGGSGPVIDV